MKEATGEGQENGHTRTTKTCRIYSVVLQRCAPPQGSPAPLYIHPGTPASSPPCSGTPPPPGRRLDSPGSLLLLQRKLSSPAAASAGWEESKAEPGCGSRGYYQAASGPPQGCKRLTNSLWFCSWMGRCRTELAPILRGVWRSGGTLSEGRK